MLTMGGGGGKIVHRVKAAPPQCISVTMHFFWAHMYSFDSRSARRLHVPYVVHAVGPNYNTCRDEAEGDELLRSAYASAMSVAAKAGIATIGFSLLSAGIFRGRRSLKV
jgi:hypothetical protein